VPVQRRSSEYRFALLHVFKDRLPTHIDPTSYLKASGEVLALLFVASWIVSLLVSPDQVTANPMNHRLGYYSLCVGFDAWPANRQALAVYIPWQITAAFDYGWFACLALTTRFLPNAPRIRATWSLDRS
jgi:hypothetical protein